MKSVNIESLMSSYYSWRKEQAELTHINISPHRLSQIFKVAESINFTRNLYLKSEDSTASKIDLIDCVLSIFLFEITAVNDALVTKLYNAKNK